MLPRNPDETAETAQYDEDIQASSTILALLQALDQWQANGFQAADGIAAVQALYTPVPDEETPLATMKISLSVGCFYDFYQENAIQGLHAIEQWLVELKRQLPWLQDHTTWPAEDCAHAYLNTFIATFLFEYFHILLSQDSEPTEQQQTLKDTITHSRPLFNRFLSIDALSQQKFRGCFYALIFHMMRGIIRDTTQDTDALSIRWMQQAYLTLLASYPAVYDLYQHFSHFDRFLIEADRIQTNEQASLAERFHQLEQLNIDAVNDYLAYFLDPTQRPAHDVIAFYFYHSVGFCYMGWSLLTATISTSFTVIQRGYYQDLLQAWITSLQPTTKTQQEQLIMLLFYLFQQYPAVVLKEQMIHWLLESNLTEEAGQKRCVDFKYLLDVASECSFEEKDHFDLALAICLANLAPSKEEKWSWYRDFINAINGQKEIFPAFYERLAAQLERRPRHPQVVQSFCVIMTTLSASFLSCFQIAFLSEERYFFRWLEIMQNYRAGFAQEILAQRVQTTKQTMLESQYQIDIIRQGLLMGTYQILDILQNIRDGLSDCDFYSLSRLLSIVNTCKKSQLEELLKACTTSIAFHALLNDKIEHDRGTEMHAMILKDIEDSIHSNYFLNLSDRIDKYMKRYCSSGTSKMPVLAFKNKIYYVNMIALLVVILFKLSDSNQLPNNRLKKWQDWITKIIYHVTTHSATEDTLMLYHAFSVNHVFSYLPTEITINNAVKINLRKTIIAYFTDWKKRLAHEKKFQQLSRLSVEEVMKQQLGQPTIKRRTKKKFKLPEIVPIQQDQAPPSTEQRPTTIVDVRDSACSVETETTEEEESITSSTAQPLDWFQKPAEQFLRVINTMLKHNACLKNKVFLERVTLANTILQQLSQEILQTTLALDEQIIFELSAEEKWNRSLYHFNWQLAECAKERPFLADLLQKEAGPILLNSCYFKDISRIVPEPVIAFLQDLQQYYATCHLSLRIAAKGTLFRFPTLARDFDFKLIPTQPVTPQQLSSMWGKFFKAHPRYTEGSGLMRSESDHWLRVGEIGINGAYRPIDLEFMLTPYSLQQELQHLSQAHLSLCLVNYYIDGHAVILPAVSRGICHTRPVLEWVGDEAEIEHLITRDASFTYFMMKQFVKFQYLVSFGPIMAAFLKRYFEAMPQTEDARHVSHVSIVKAAVDALLCRLPSRTHETVQWLLSHDPLLKIFFSLSESEYEACKQYFEAHFMSTISVLPTMSAEMFLAMFFIGNQSTPTIPGAMQYTYCRTANALLEQVRCLKDAETPEAINDPAYEALQLAEKSPAAAIFKQWHASAGFFSGTRGGDHSDRTRPSLTA